MLEEKNLGYLGEGVTNATVTWQKPRATGAPKGHHSPSKELDNPTRFSHPIVGTGDMLIHKAPLGRG